MASSITVNNTLVKKELLYLFQCPLTKCDFGNHRHELLDVQICGKNGTYFDEVFIKYFFY